MAKTQRTELLPRADAILDAAAGLLTEDGGRKPRVEAVAEAAGVAKGTVYLHWRSRDALLLAVGAREAAAILDAVRAAIETDPAEAALHRYIRRHFVEASRRPVLRAVFGGDQADLGALDAERERSGTVRSTLVASREYLTALDAHQLLRPGQDLDDVDYGLQAVAYGFFAAEPLLSGPEEADSGAPARSRPPRPSLDRRADRLADIVRRSFEPARAPAPERLRAAAPHAVAAFTGLAGHFRRLAYGSAAD